MTYRSTRTIPHPGRPASAAIVMFTGVVAAEVPSSKRALARLARLDPKLLYPLKHRGEDSQAHMALIRSRQALVGSRQRSVGGPRSP